MKNLIYSVLSVILIIASTIFCASAQNSETRKVTGFKYLVSGVTCDVHVKIDGTESLRISTNSDVGKVIKTFVENDTLKINYIDNLADGQGNSDGPVDIYVTAKSLSSVVKNGAGSIDIDGALTGNNVNITSNGSGIIKSSVDCKNLKIVMCCSGRINVDGTADKADITTNGASMVNGAGLKTKNALVSLTGSGDIYLSAENTVSAQIEGSGSVRYSGNAVITNSKSDGPGSISKAN
jgi:hypothetical protein